MSQATFNGPGGETPEHRRNSLVLPAQHKIEHAIERLRTGREVIALSVGCSHDALSGPNAWEVDDAIADAVHDLNEACCFLGDQTD